MSVYEIQSRTTVGSHQLERAVDRTSQKKLQALWPDVSPELTRLASSMGINTDRVDDVTQDVFHVAWKGPVPCETDDELRRWLIRVTVNHCNLIYRHHHRWRRAWRHIVGLRATLLSPHEASGYGNAVTNDERKMIAQALDDLPVQQRNVLVLRYFQQYDSAMIGSILQMPPATVRSHLRKARMRLASKLRQLGYKDE